MHVRAPIFVARQWMRHRMASINEVSLRYTEADNDAVMDVRGLGPLCRDPDPKDSKQGRGEPLNLGRWPILASESLDAYALSPLGFTLDLQMSDIEYKHARKAGIAREQARVLLPLATMTEWVWKVDLHNLLHFLGLRTKPDAQREIRLLADEIAAIVADAYPLTWAAWVEHVRDAPRLSASAWRALAGIVDADRLADALSGLPERERRETLAALTAAWGAHGSDSLVTIAAIKARRRAQARADRQGVVPAAVLADLATAEAMRREKAAGAKISDHDIILAFGQVGKK